jgi:plastocyanin
MAPAGGHDPEEQHKVQLSVNDKGEFTYSPSFVRVKRGDTITFSTNPGHHFAVMFKGQSPGNKLSLSDDQPTMTISDNAPNGVYHYAAAISVGIKVHLDSGCGDVGVEN